MLPPPHLHLILFYVSSAVGISFESIDNKINNRNNRNNRNKPNRSPFVDEYGNEKGRDDYDEHDDHGDHGDTQREREIEIEDNGSTLSYVGIGYVVYLSYDCRLLYTVVVMFHIYWCTREPC